jgi:hypothetical protein
MGLPWTRGGVAAGSSPDGATWQDPSSQRLRKGEEITTILTMGGNRRCGGGDEPVVVIRRRGESF